MNNQELIVIEQLPIIKEHLKKVAEEIDEKVENAKKLVCTEENKQSIKKIRTEMNKELEEFESQRKAVKEKVLAPYTRFIMDDDELKMSTMSIGYRMRYEKFNFLRKLNIDVLALNFTTNDLFRISRVKMERGLDYPFARSYTLSLSLIFK